MPKLAVAIAFASLVLLPVVSHSDPLLFDNFDSGYPGWNADGDVMSEGLRVLVANSVRMRQSGSITRTFSTAGYDRIRVSAFLAARLLEDGDGCVFEVSADGGSSWTPLLQLGNGEDDGEFRWSEQGSIEWDDNPNVVLRFRNTSNALSDHCYAEDVTVGGFAIGSSICEGPPVAPPYPAYVQDFDPLSGAGTTARSELSAALLNSGSPLASPVSSAAFGIPLDAAAPLHSLEGRIELLAEATSGSFAELVDDFSYTGNGDDPRKHLPDFDFEFVQTGSHLLPRARGIVLSSHPYWEFIIEPGRVWSESGDGGMSRAALPFSLQQRNSNCVHNGLLTFLFDDSVLSKVAYQITSETCLYFQFDMWGVLSATYSPGAVADALDFKHAHQRQLAGRMPLKPIAELAVDHPGIDPAEFAHPSEVAAANLSIYGVVFEGVHYAGGCETRFGAHPYCDSLRVPSYSTAKTSFAASASMWLERVYPGFLSQPIENWVPEAAADPENDWDGVTVEHALDMATGNYRLSGYIADENSISTNDFFLPETHAEKVAYSASRYPRSASPGSEMHYHTTDTYLAVTAAQRYLREQAGWCADLFDDVMVEQIWAPLGFDAGSLSTRRTYDPVEQPFGGFGLSYLRNDVARLGVFLGVDHGRIDGSQTLAPEALAAGKFSDPLDPGLAWSVQGDYKLAFWGRDKSAETGCTTMVPYLSGYGGITIALTPGGVVYYYFSDGNEFVWDRAFSEAENLRASCNVGAPAPPTALAAPSVGPSEVELQWTPAEDPVGVIRYRVYRDGQLIATTSGNEWTDIGPTIEHSTYYEVESLDVAGGVSLTRASLIVSGTPAEVPALSVRGVATLTAFLLSLGAFGVRRTRSRLGEWLPGQPVNR